MPGRVSPAGSDSTLGARCARFQLIHLLSVDVALKELELSVQTAFRMSAFFPVISALNPAAMPKQMPATSSARPSVLATSTAKWDARLSHDPVHDNAFYGKCMVGGILSCGITHTGITPLDVVKCNMQVNPAKYKSLLSGLKTIASEEGIGALYKGWAPTAFGYSMQGMCKFGFYDVFKDMYSTMAGEENAYKYRGAIYLAGSASAEFFADILLCPM
ncbi:hypothetical protein PRIC1_003419 [Phytophthora ramorum]